MIQISEQTIEALKREAKRARKASPTLTHAQHLNALAADWFGVRNYHELLQRVQPAAPAPSFGKIIAMGTTGMGTGKTTILLNLAGRLATLGTATASYRVLLVDCDGGSTPAPASASSWLRGRADTAQALPFSIEFVPLDQLEAKLAAFRTQFDFILVDVPPLGSEAIVGRVADIVLLPSKPDALIEGTLSLRLSNWASDVTKPRFVLFGGRGALKGDRKTATDEKKWNSSDPRFGLYDFAFPESSSVANANTRGELLTEVKHAPRRYLEEIQQLARFCISTARGTVAACQSSAK